MDTERSDDLGPSFRDECHRGLEYTLRLVRQRGLYRPYSASSPYRIYSFMRELGDESAEHMYQLSLGQRGDVLGVYLVGKGSCNRCGADPKEVFKPAFASNAVRIALVHNHPSGDVSPSAEDLAFSRRIRQGGEILGIPLVDSLIIGDGRYLSLAERSLLD